MVALRDSAKKWGPRIFGERVSNAVRLLRARRSVTRLGAFYRTDKAGPVHRYTRHYQKFFQQWRKDAFVLLEIGIGGYAREGAGGGSLRMWKQFFRRAQIVGLDIEDKRFAEEDRIRVYQGDQSDAELLRRIVDEVGRPRIIIDDGSHFSHHVIATFEVLFPLLVSGGYYVIEDTQTSYWPEWHGAADRHAPGTTMAMVKDLIDGLNYKEFVDDAYEPTYTDKSITEVHCFHNLVIIRKGRNNEPTRKRRILRNRYQKGPPANG